MTFYDNPITFKELIHSLSINCALSCYRGNPSGGRLWVVIEKFIDMDFGLKEEKTIVGVFNIKKVEEKFATSFFTEEQLWCTKFVDCPLKYLDLVSCPKDKNAAQWRAKVYEYHNNRIEKRLAKKEAKVAAKKLEEIKNKNPKELTLEQKEQIIANALENPNTYKYLNPMNSLFFEAAKQKPKIDKSLGFCYNCNSDALYKKDKYIVCSNCGAVHDVKEKTLGYNKHLISPF